MFLVIWVEISEINLLSYHAIISHFIHHISWDLILTLISFLLLSSSVIHPILTHCCLVAIWRHISLSTLVKVMACHQFSAKRLPESMLNYCQLYAWETNLSEISNKMKYVSFKKTHLKIATTKQRPFCPVPNVSNHSQDRPNTYLRTNHGELSPLFVTCIIMRAMRHATLAAINCTALSVHYHLLKSLPPILKTNASRRHLESYRLEQYIQVVV